MENFDLKWKLECHFFVFSVSKERYVFASFFGFERKKNKKSHEIREDLFWTFSKRRTIGLGKISRD